jgi:hypothetical protein
MKKKIIYGLLFAVAMVTASSSFVSCKDYEGDNYAGLIDRTASLAELLEQQRIALQNCSTNCANQRQLLQNQLNDLSNSLSALRAKEKADSLTLANGINNLRTDLNSLIAKEKSDSALLRGLISGLDTRIQTIENALANYVTQDQLGNYATKEDLNDYVKKGEFGSYVTTDKFTTDSAEFMRIITQNQLAIAAVTALAKADSIRIDQLRSDYNTLSNDFTTLKNTYENFYNNEFTTLSNDFTTLSNNFTTLKNNFENFYNNEYTTLSNNFTTLSNNFNTYLSAWGSDLASAIAEVARVRALISVTAADTAAWNLASVQAQEAMDSINSWSQYLEKWNEAVTLSEEAAEWITSTDHTDMNINNVDDLIDAYMLADEALAERINALQEEVDKLKNSLAKMITGVIIQGTYSPVLGNGSLPLGIQTNLLAAYAGTSTADVAFPSRYNEDYADGTSVFTEGDEAYLKGLGFWPAEVEITKGDYIISDRDDNAGKLYLTVNPTNTDFTGTTFEMVNSAGQVSRMELSELKPSEDVLNFGWTRGSSANGFYEVNAKVTKENIKKLQANIDTKQFQKAFKEQLNSENTGLVSYAAMMDLARAVYSSLEPLQRNGIRATWMDEAAGYTRSYTSSYDLAATVVNPLGFGFTIPDTKYTRFPVFDTNYLRNRYHFKGEAKLLVAQSKESGAYSYFLEVPRYMISENGSIVLEDGTILNVDGTDGRWVVLDENGEPDYYFYDEGVALAEFYRFYGYDDQGIIYQLRDGYILIDLTDVFTDIYGEVNTGLSTINDIIAQANKRIDWVVNYIDRYNRYATKANRWIKNANNLLQPVLLWCDSENVGQLGGMITGNYAVGTIVPAGGAVNLVPTSYTLELIAPAFKKSVIVTNAYKDGKSAQGVGGELEAAVKEINQKLKDGGFDLYEGQSLKNAFLFEAKDSYKGMTFEIAYTAIDYTGQIAGRKFYITVE